MCPCVRVFIHVTGRSGYKEQHFASPTHTLISHLTYIHVHLQTPTHSSLLRRGTDSPLPQWLQGEATDFIAHTHTHTHSLFLFLSSHIPRKKTRVSEWTSDRGMHHEGELSLLYIYLVCMCLSVCMCVRGVTGLSVKIMFMNWFHHFFSCLDYLSIFLPNGLELRIMLSTRVLLMRKW